MQLMNNNFSIIKGILILIIISLTHLASAQYYPDQYYETIGAEDMFNNAESVSNVTLSADLKSIVLEESENDGILVLEPVTLDQQFDRGLPSWNGKASKEINSSFKVEMRFKFADIWSKWVTVGFWDKNVWSSYGATSFSGGEVDIDYVKLDSYISTFQFRVQFRRPNAAAFSPELRQLAFFASDSEYPVDIPAIVADNPDEIFIDTDHIFQYSVDDEIGPSICSPTTTSMIIKSFGLEVDPFLFAERTYDPYWHLFGVWPRVVANASEYGLNGAVTRYRTWSDAAEVLKKDGRIAMSVGLPLYSGHLIMLAGFDANGNPIVHDPAKSNGYAYVFNKQSLSESWFNKGGISYTFYRGEDFTNIQEFALLENSLSIYPNPVTENAVVKFYLDKQQHVTLKIYDLNGRSIAELNNSFLDEGEHTIHLSVSELNLQQGFYIASLKTQTNYTLNQKIIIK